ncbi:glycerophosphodiester phosphodiesterase [Halorarum salinum]|uniref:Glycerophosphodiester phosphodiesterase n=1 Tax=Halorarum salinum TaxID=2743089 RepID=A0A7D5L8Y0_9EURY|nr:glycerophosphodiester phosphodiesterase [Halobaculum salinum]QLG60874.1 glycerophosphodiester phosphodiesterase [Halobaculum salinum]
MPALIAHRGFAGDHPENTLGAFRAAAGTAAMLELDVRRCGSGEVVVFHDAELGRVTGRRGAVAETPYDVLADCEVLDSGEGVPLLADVFAAVPPSVGVNVELKTVDVAADAAELAAAASHDVVVSSFRPDALRAVAGVADDLPLAHLFLPEADDPIGRARSLGCDYLHPPKAVADADLVEAAHDRGLGVNAWTVKTPAEATRLVAAGVDGLIADHGDVLG